RELYEKAAEKGDRSAMNQLMKPADEAAGAGRYTEALQLQEALVEKVETWETKLKGKAADDTAQTLHDLASYALLAREFTKALTASDRAHALLPDNLLIETNRAHALMFLRGEASKALYLAYKGKFMVRPHDSFMQRWERVIADDFAEFRKAGLMHPM